MYKLRILRNAHYISNYTGNILSCSIDIYFEQSEQIQLVFK